MTKAPIDVILASSSEIRAQLLRRAGLTIAVSPARVDEESLMAALVAEGVSPRDIADTLAEAKARKVSDKNPAALVLGCDQTLDLKGALFAKAGNVEEAESQLAQLQGQTHHLYSAAVLYQNGQPLWRHIGQARMTMRALSPDARSAYLARNWVSVRQAVGCYKIEEEGIQLFANIDGDTFTIQGLPLIPLLGYLAQKGVIAS